MIETQSFLAWPIEIKPCRLGVGLFATRAIDVGELVFEFTGAVISLEQTIAKGDTDGNCLQIGIDAYIDLEPPSVFGNHSCEPNVGIVGVSTVKAIRPIQSGEELLYDYSTTMWEDRWEMPCSCGAASCRQFVRDFVKLPAERQQEYLQLGIVQPFIARQLEGRSSRAHN